MFQVNTLDTTLAGPRKARIAIENMQDRLFDGWERLGKLLFSRADAVQARHADDVQPLSRYYASASERVCSSAPVSSFRDLLDVDRV